jgi:hypothetical protein
MKKLLCSLLLLAPAALAAQPTRFEISPYAGYRLNGAIDSRDSFDQDLEVKESAVYGLRLDIPLGSNLQLEILGNRQDSSFQLDEGVLEPSLELGDVTLDTVHAGLLYQWGNGQVNPYVVFSGGITRIDPDFPDLESESRLSGSIGGGVKVFVNRNVGFRFEARGYWIDLDTEFDEDECRRCRDNGSALYLGEANAGLVFSF